MCAQKNLMEFEKRNKSPSLFPEIDDQLLCSGGVECQVVDGALSQFLDFSSVEGLVTILYQFQNSSFIRKLNVDIYAVGWGAVRGVEGVEKRAQHPTLWSSSAKCHEQGVMGAEKDSL